MKNRLNDNIKTAGKFIIIYLILAGLFYVMAKPQILYKAYDQEVLTADDTLGEIVDTDVIVQEFEYAGNYIEQIVFNVGTYNRKNQGVLTIQLGDASQALWTKQYDISKFKDNSKLIVPMELELQDGSIYYIKIMTSGCSYGNAVTFYINTGSNVHQGILSRNGVLVTGELQFNIEGGRNRWFGTVFWGFVLLAGIVGCLQYVYCKNQWMYSEKPVWKELRSIKKYKFLLRQLVERDFKTRYKRSALGFCWSFLNPVLTMVVQYVVFSTIFRSDIDNFPVYLLSAGILFNFFTESVGAGLGSIVGNVSLITKVYVPKYIYPLSRVLSTAINLLISMIPLMLTVILTGEDITIVFLMIPFVLICLIVFCIGISLALSSSMVFFRDTQFLWGIISLIWMYATPIFYPESIIPNRFRIVLTCNPMYHYLKFFRTILLTGNSPELVEYVFCFGFSILALAVGLFIFKKTERKFVLYL